ncbi:MAG: hypothetical protein Kow00109_15880 [Acidobacteriota bacterium]
MVEQHDPAGAVTRTEYVAATAFAYPARVINALGHATALLYDFETGLLLAVTDPNGATTTYSYDAYNRRVGESRPDGGWTQWRYYDSWNAGAYRTVEEVETAVDAGTTVVERRYFDAVGRLLRSEQEAGGVVLSRVDREYGACNCGGRVAWVSEPYAPGQTPVWWERHYDGLGRLVLEVPPDGTTSTNRVRYSYGVGTRSVPGAGSLSYTSVEVTDETGRRRTYFYEVTGELFEVAEGNAGSFSPNGRTWITTHVDPDVRTSTEYRNGQRIRYAKWLERRITQTWREGPSWNYTETTQQRSLRYDNLGRLRAETHPETGTTAYDWDDAGRLVQRTDARGIVTTTSYDALGRPVFVAYSDPTPDVQYTYDQGPNGVGRLYAVANAVATSVFFYDPMGRVTREEQVIDGRPFVGEYAYNWAGGVTQVRWPDGTVLTRHYDAAGRLEALTSSWADAQHPAVLAENLTYDAAGRLVSVDYGNGTRSLRSYNARGQLERLRHGTSGAPGGLLDLGFDFHLGGDNNGLLRRLIDYRDRSRDVSFTYDEYYRLVAAETAGSHWGLAWSYDAWGNRTAQVVTKGTAPERVTAVDPATNRVVGWSYDAAGNVLSDGQHSYTWDAENRLAAVDGTVTYAYDGRGRRVKEATGGEVTYFVLGMGEYTPGVGWKRRFVYLGREKLVEYSGGTTWFYHPDHLGTPRVKTDVTGGEVARWEYYPYGERAGGPAERHGFTGHWAEDGGLVFAGRRYYAAAAGRWLSADPVAGDPARPWTLNRYSYAWNDPVNYLDPDGGEPEPVAHFTVTVTANVVYATYYVTALAHGLFGIPQRPAKVALETPGPMPGVTEERKQQMQIIAATVQDAIRRLRERPDCAQFLQGSSGIDPAQKLQSLLRQGRIQPADLGAPAFADYTVTDAETSAHNSLIVLNTSGAFFNPARVVTSEGVVVNHLAAFNEALGSRLDPGGYRELVLLHEVGHLTGVLEWDAGDPVASMRNIRAVLANCF